MHRALSTKVGLSEMELVSVPAPHHGGSAESRPWARARGEEPICGTLGLQG